jgi:20S proteasome subunit alpha 7
MLSVAHLHPSASLVQHFNFSIYSVHDDAKDKAFELELSWVCEETGNLHKFVPKDLLEEAEKYAKQALEEEEDMSEEED